MMVLRDRDDDEDPGIGDLGFAGSGLDLRVWIMQGLDGSAWRVTQEGGSSIDYDQFLYTPQGKVNLLRHNSPFVGDYSLNVPNSPYSWRHLWRGGRASIS